MIISHHKYRTGIHIEDSILNDIISKSSEGHIIQLFFEYRTVNNINQLCVSDYELIHKDKTNYKYDGTPGILVNNSYPGPKEMTERGYCHFITLEEVDEFVFPKTPFFKLGLFS